MAKKKNRGTPVPNNPTMNTKDRLLITCRRYIEIAADAAESAYESPESMLYQDGELYEQSVMARALLDEIDCELSTKH